ncbi:uncharacterized protein LOC133706686 [Rosa rugosa]|uniref:uncharacterized protein LOC133706686 n=1 Tax=Rosa rugosa TaxID=74645 RepID=UPI002B40A273|nr:uncharacterized protein LOC133706686 [Rosa rugosa]
MPKAEKVGGDLRGCLAYFTDYCLLGNEALFCIITSIEGIPEQQGDKTCGFWIMHYMKDIVEDKNQEWSAKWDRKGSNMYTQNDIDKVRAEWAQYVAQFQES